MRGWISPQPMSALLSATEPRAAAESAGAAMTAGGAGTDG